MDWCRSQIHQKFWQIFGSWQGKKKIIATHTKDFFDNLLDFEDFFLNCQNIEVFF
jgi:hypothetical protein